MGCGGDTMKKRGFNPFGLPTLLSILILILVYSVVSVLLVDVRQTHNSILKSMDFVADSYMIEKETDQLIADVNNIYQSQSSFEEFLLKIDNLEMVNYDKEEDAITIDFISETQMVKVILDINHENKNLILVSKRLSIINNQDYSLNGDPVYGGQ